LVPLFQVRAKVRDAVTVVPFSVTLVSLVAAVAALPPQYR
jgi:hypothetical protein